MVSGSPLISIEACHRSEYSAYVSQFRRADERTRTADLTSSRVGCYRVHLVSPRFASALASRPRLCAWVISSFVGSDELSFIEDVPLYGRQEFIFAQMCRCI